MSDHKFEHQVGQKLNDLKITPSTESWVKIEDRLRQEKRRPAPIFWLPLLLIGIAIGGYFIYNNNRPKADLATTTTQKADSADNKPGLTNEAGPLPDLSSEVDEQQAAEPVPQQVIAPLINKQKAGNTIAKPENVPSVVNNKNRLVSDNTFTQPSTSSVNPQALSVDQESVKAISPSPNELSITEKKDMETEKGTDVEVTENKSYEEKNAVKPIENNPVTTADDSDADTPNTTGKKESSEIISVLQQEKDKVKKSSKWSFGITGSGGLTAINKGKILSFTPGTMDAVELSSRQQYYGAMAVLPEPKPSKIYPGIGFSFGAMVKKELSERFAISAGLNYLRISNVIQVGYKVERMNTTGLNPPDPQNTPVPTQNTTDPFYLATDNYSNEYVNKYNYIELPITLHTKLNRSEKLPVYWNAGVGVAKLITSNALHYDRNTKLYFQNNELINDLQASVSTGFSISVLNQRPRPLWIGPTVRYNLSSALKKDVTVSNKHFMGVGLDVKWFFQ